MHKDAVTELLKAEANSITSLIGHIEEPLWQAVDLCLSCRGRLIVVGLGKSGIIGRKIAATLTSTGSSSFFIHAGEALHGDLGTVTEHDCAIMISKSGNTEEILRLIPFLMRMGVKIIAITAGNDSILAQKADVVLDIRVTEEAEPIGLVPTTSTTATMAVGDALAVALMVKKGFTLEDFAAVHPAGNIGNLLRRVSEVMHSEDNIPKVGRDANLLEGIVEMSAQRLGHVLVVEGRKCLAILSDGDLRRTLQKHAHEDIANLPIIQEATQNPKSVGPHEMVEEAMRIMETNKITALPVIDDGILVGIIHLHDLLESKVV